MKKKSLKRVHVLEFEDLAWFPGWLRTCMTNNIVVLARWLRVPAALRSLVDEARKQYGFSRIVDLGSGGGGVMPDVIAQLNEKNDSTPMELWMTDKFPNEVAMVKFNSLETPHIRYEPLPVEAENFQTLPDGLKTMVNCFHHMRPEQARTILASAFQNRQPFLVYEMGGHFIPPFALWLLLLPLNYVVVALLSWVKSAMVRPLTWKQIVFTYLIPVIPIFYAWDASASVPRMYSFQDIESLLDGLRDDGYTWQQGYGYHQGKKVGSYLLGLPSAASTPTQDTFVSDGPAA